MTAFWQPLGWEHIDILPFKNGILIDEPIELQGVMTGRIICHGGTCAICMWMRRGDANYPFAHGV
jgi:hypothetical protein